MSDISIVLIVGAVCLFWLSLLFDSGIKLWAILLVASFHLIRYAVITGMVVAFLCMPQMYNVIGCTPASVILGRRVYEDIERTSKPPIIGPKPHQSKIYRGKKHGQR
jgi:hypothetical protein